MRMSKFNSMSIKLPIGSPDPVTTATTLMHSKNRTHVGIHLSPVSWLQKQMQRSSHSPSHFAHNSYPHPCLSIPFIILNLRKNPLFHKGLRDLLVRPPGTPCLNYTPSQCRAFTNVTRRQQNKPQRIMRRECFDSLEMLKQTWLQLGGPYT
ncbi:hypothetical protein BDW60DRAFT_10422 [Aspergillus nidulans var. acristatus]